jgi:hypothetical protein
MEFCERHLPVLENTAIALLPVQNESNIVWSEHVATVTPQNVTRWRMALRNVHQRVTPGGGGGK